MMMMISWTRQQVINQQHVAPHVAALFVFSAFFTGCTVAPALC